MYEFEDFVRLMNSRLLKKSSFPGCSKRALPARKFKRNSAWRSKNGGIRGKAVIKQILNDPSKKAVKECLRLIEKSPGDKRLRLKLGDLYLRSGDKEKAIREYLCAADLFAEEDLNERAIALYKRVVSLAPTHLGTFLKMAELYLKERLLGDAKVCYEKILKIRPNDQDALKGLSIIEDVKQSKKVETKIEKEEFLPPKSEGSLSESPLTEAEILPPDKDLELHYHLGIGYKEMGLLDYAITEFELASKDPSMRFDCFVMLGECFKERGDSEQSMKYFEWASQIKDLPEHQFLDRSSTGG
jgi:tetratricopeptide (TPR) repeat protein